MITVSHMSDNLNTDELRGIQMFLSPGEAEFQAYECRETGDQRMVRAFYLDDSETLHVYSPKVLEKIDEDQKRSTDPEVRDYLHEDVEEADYIDRLLTSDDQLVDAEIIGYEDLPERIQEHV